MQAVRDQSGGRVPLRTGSFYRHLSRLIDAGLVTEAPPRRPGDDPRRGTHYRLTPLGRRTLATERRRLADLGRRVRRAASRLSQGPRMSVRPPALPWAERLYGWVLRAYPRHFRARYEAGMRDAFRSEQAGRKPGFRAAVRFWTMTIAEAVWFGLRERMRGRTAPARAISTRSLHENAVRRRLARRLALAARHAARHFRGRAVARPWHRRQYRAVLDSEQSALQTLARSGSRQPRPGRRRLVDESNLGADSPARSTVRRRVRLVPDAVRLVATR